MSKFCVESVLYPTTTFNMAVRYCFARITGNHCRRRRFKLSTLTPLPRLFLCFHCQFECRRANSLLEAHDKQLQLYLEESKEVTAARLEVVRR